MHTTPHLPAAAALLALVNVTGACRSTTAPEADRRTAAGLYNLESVTGRGPASGTFYLTANGTATRRVRYATPGIPERDYVMAGTFLVQADGNFEFALREDGGRSPYVLKYLGQRRGTRFSIRYGDPADGPDIVETYRRQ